MESTRKFQHFLFFTFDKDLAAIGFSTPKKKSAKGIEGLFEFVDHVLDNAPKGISFDTMKPKPVKNCI